MSDRQPSSENRSQSSTAPTHSLLQSALEQFHEDCRLYNAAVGSYNTHLDNHRERRALHDLPFRDPVTAHPAFDDAATGDRDGIETLLTYLVDQAHLDSQLRRHPRTFPIHREAVEHLQIAREQLLTTLEDAHHHLREEDD